MGVLANLLTWEALGAVIAVISASVAWYQACSARKANKRAIAAAKEANDIQEQLLELARAKETREITAEQREEEARAALHQTARLTCSLHSYSNSGAVNAVIKNQGLGMASEINVRLRGIGFKPTRAPERVEVPDTLDSGKSIQLELWKPMGATPPSVTVSWKHPSGKEGSLTEHLN